MYFSRYTYTQHVSVFLLHCIGCVVVHSMVVFVGEMGVDVAHSAFELSTNASSLNSDSKLSFPMVDNIDGTNVVVCLWIHPPVDLSKCMNNLSIPGMITMIFHCVLVSGRSIGWDLLLFYLTSLVSGGKWDL